MLLNQDLTWSDIEHVLRHDMDRKQLSNYYKRLQASYGPGVRKKIKGTTPTSDEDNDDRSADGEALLEVDEICPIEPRLEMWGTPLPHHGENHIPFGGRPTDEPLEAAATDPNFVTQQFTALLERNSCLAQAIDDLSRSETYKDYLTIDQLLQEGFSFSTMGAKFSKVTGKKYGPQSLVIAHGSMAAVVALVNAATQEPVGAKVSTSEPNVVSLSTFFDASAS